MVDLFGRPVYESSKARQLELFPDSHWFHLGYQDAQHGQPYSRRYLSSERPAYGYGYTAGTRDKAAGQDSAERAWAQARAVSNVTA
jgi:hypothetical protein